MTRQELFTDRQTELYRAWQEELARGITRASLELERALYSELDLQLTDEEETASWILERLHRAAYPDDPGRPRMATEQQWPQLIE